MGKPRFLILQVLLKKKVHLLRKHAVEHEFDNYLFLVARLHDALNKGTEHYVHLCSPNNTFLILFMKSIIAKLPKSRIKIPLRLYTV